MKTFGPRLKTHDVFRIKPFKKVKSGHYYDPAWIALRNETVRRLGSFAATPNTTRNPRAGVGSSLITSLSSRTAVRCSIQQIY